MKIFTTARETAAMLKDIALLVVPVAGSVALGVGTVTSGLEELAPQTAAGIMALGGATVWTASVIADRAADRLRGWFPEYSGNARRMAEKRVWYPDSIVLPYMGGAGAGLVAGDPVFLAAACIGIAGYSCKRVLEVSGRAQEYLETVTELDAERKGPPLKL